MRQSLPRCQCEGRLPNLRVPISVACQTQPLRTSGPRRGIVTQAQQLKDGTTNALITTKGQTAEGAAAHPHHREASATAPTHVELKCSPGQLLSVTAVASALAGAVLFGPGPLPAALQQPLYIAQSLGVLAAIVAVHEAGHFAAARLQRGSVEYSLRLIPMGGFVAFPDDDPKSNIPKGGGSLTQPAPCSPANTAAQQSRSQDIVQPNIL
ncbi:PDZ domain-containing protein [Haematococcus lacustris]|uniref:PDZ domain-containing protein n=1 Tax=Haematococcus lacustris TaxID=44745 RepID=A0A699ZL99_HAELA|nr:PDZ domain-containing protein [Haematococcus lacustris]